MKHLSIIFVMQLILYPMQSFAGHESNGGGGFVCYNPQGQITKVIAFDRWVGSEDRGLDIPIKFTSYKDQIEDALDKLNVIHTGLAKIARSTLEITNSKIWHQLEHQGEQKPSVNRDFSPWSEPIPEWCPNLEDQITYRTFVNYRDGFRYYGDALSQEDFLAPKLKTVSKINQDIIKNAPADALVIDKDFFQFTVDNDQYQTDLAMILLHEALYKVFRRLFNYKNSDNVLYFVGLLFSSFQAEEIQEQLKDNYFLSFLDNHLELLFFDFFKPFQGPWITMYITKELNNKKVKLLGFRRNLLRSMDEELFSLKSKDQIHKFMQEKWYINSIELLPLKANTLRPAPKSDLFSPLVRFTYQNLQSARRDGVENYITMLSYAILRKNFILADYYLDQADTDRSLASHYYDGLFAPRIHLPIDVLDGLDIDMNNPQERYWYRRLRGRLTEQR